MAFELPLPDPLGLLQAEATAVNAPVIPVDPLVYIARKWLGRMMEAREKAVFNYAEALKLQPLSPGARMRAIRNYDEAMRHLPGKF